MADLGEKMRRPLRGGLQRALDSNLSPDERIEISGIVANGQAIFATDCNVIIIKAGIGMGVGLFAAAAKSFPYNAISGVDLRVGFTGGGHLKLTIPGSPQSAASGTLRQQAR